MLIHNYKKYNTCEQIVFIPLFFVQEDGKQPVELFELRSNGSTLCTRLVQVKADATQLNSTFW